MPPLALVTGATGCVGANVVAALVTRGYRVRALRRRSSSLTALEPMDPEVVVGDLLDSASLAAATEGCELVFHVGAVSDWWRVPAARIYEVNVEGTRNVVQAAMAARVERLVYTSSIGALGMPPTGQQLDESATFNLPPRRFVYGHSKHLAEQIVQKAVSTGMDAVIVNPTSVIGARDVNFIGGTLVRDVKRGLGWVTFPGGLNWVDAEAVGLGHVLAAERGRSGSRYILGGENVSHRRAMEIVAEVVDGRKPLLTLPRILVRPAAALFDGLNAIRPGATMISGEQARLSGEFIYANCELARQQLGFPLVRFRSGVANAFAWYQAHGYL